MIASPNPAIAETAPPVGNQTTDTDTGVQKLRLPTESLAKSLLEVLVIALFERLLYRVESTATCRSHCLTLAISPLLTDHDADDQSLP
jgi:hypothetical protein